MEPKVPGAKCDECPYGERGGFVPTLNITPKSKIAIVGEAPGAYEAAYGIPFTGPSGELLNNVLEHHGIQRSEVMITNSCLCRPDNNEDPPKKALEACAPRLHRELAESGVETVIAVGKAASHSLLDDKRAMRKLRVGPPKPYKLDEKIKVISTWHPAYCLRSPDAFPDFVYDVGKINGKKIDDWVEPQYRVVDSVELALRVIEELGKRYHRFVLDIECGAEKDSDYVHPSEWPLLCVGLAFETKKAVVFGETVVNNQRVMDELGKLLRRSQLVAHNGKFDLEGLQAVCGKLSLWFDTMLGSYCLNERPGHHSLEQLSIERLGSPNWKFDIKQHIPRGGNYADVPKHILYRYNAIDVSNTWDLMENILGVMDENDRLKRDLLISAANVLVPVELAGIAFDEVYNKELAERFLDELDGIKSKIVELIGHDINPNSVQQVQGYYHNHGFILPTTGADFLKELRPKLDGEVGEFTDLLLHHRVRSKLYGTYVKGLARRVSHGRVYTTYLLHGTTSGRLSSREPNLQNITREKYIRNQFTASSDENVLVQLDYKQAEGRVIATLANDEYLRNIFRDDERDIFNEFCNDIFGVGKWNKENRVAMKSIFYGNAYGRGVASITRELNLQGLPISDEEVRTLMREFNALIPQVMAWQASIKHRVLSGEDLITPYGRRRSFWLITDKNRSDVLNEALSFLPQSIASDITLSALIDVQPRLPKDATMRLTIHDALVFECHRTRVDEIAGMVREAMLNSARKFTNYVPFAVDITSGYRWGEL